ncbi:MAG: terminase, partial [Firmicutes bacterium]|nr:terminase [Bacillota bacterium]
METRIGNQYPTQSYVLPYRKSHGSEAVELYSRTGRQAQEWQQLLLEDILAYNEDDLFVHTKYGYAVPRRNGKNEIVIIREMWGLMNGEHILHTAHRTSTSHSAWERLLDLLVMANIQVVSSYRASGKELIEIYTGGKIEFRTRTSKGGLGEGFDLLVIDEAQEYQDDQESALKYVVSDSKNPQTIFCGTPPTPVSAGTVFTKFRN